MSEARLTTTIKSSIRQIDILFNYYTRSHSLESRFQYLIVEVITLRLFAILENGIAELAYKLGSGATYLSGKRPRLSIQARSLTKTRENMINFGRPKGIQLRWTKESYVKDSVKYVINQNESFVKAASIHGSKLNEMNVVRNHIAHRNTASRRKFRVIIRQRFGAHLQISIGAYLLSTKRVSTPVIQEYLLQCKIMLNDFAKG